MEKGKSDGRRRSLEKRRFQEVGVRRREGRPGGLRKSSPELQDLGGGWALGLGWARATG